MLEHVAHLLGLREQVDWVDAPAALHRPQQPLQRGKPVGHDQRNRVARHGPLGQQQCSHLPATACQLPKAELLATLVVHGVQRIGAQTGLSLDELANACAHARPNFSKNPPKIACSLGRRSVMGRAMRVMLR